MEQGQDVLTLIQDRIKLLTELKELLFQQQNALVTSDTAEISHYSELQVECMEKLQPLEMQWRDLIKEYKQKYDLPSTTAEQAISMVLDEPENTKFFAYYDQLKRLVSEIDMIKRNNTLLIQNSLGLVRSTLRQLRGETSKDAVYHPRRKQETGHILLDKTL